MLRVPTFATVRFYSTTTTTRSMPALSYVLSGKDQLNLPGVTYASKTTAKELLLKDAEEHHCFFRQSGFHNHVSHQ